MQNSTEPDTTEDAGYSTILHGMVDCLSTFECYEKSVNEPRTREFCSRDHPSKSGRPETKFWIDAECITNGSDSTDVLSPDIAIITVFKKEANFVRIKRELCRVG